MLCSKTSYVAARVVAAFIFVGSFSTSPGFAQSTVATDYRVPNSAGRAIGAAFASPIAVDGFIKNCARWVPNSKEYFRRVRSTWHRRNSRSLDAADDLYHWFLIKQYRSSGRAGAEKFVNYLASLTKKIRDQSGRKFRGLFEKIDAHPDQDARLRFCQQIMERIRDGALDVEANTPSEFRLLERFLADKNAGRGAVAGVDWPHYNEKVGFAPPSEYCVADPDRSTEEWNRVRGALDGSRFTPLRVVWALVSCEPSSGKRLGASQENNDGVNSYGGILQAYRVPTPDNITKKNFVRILGGELEKRLGKQCRRAMTQVWQDLGGAGSSAVSCHTDGANVLHAIRLTKIKQAGVSRTFYYKSVSFIFSENQRYKMSIHASSSSKKELFQMFKSERDYLESISLAPTGMKVSSPFAPQKP